MPADSDMVMVPRDKLEEVARWLERGVTASVLGQCAETLRAMLSASPSTTSTAEQPGEGEAPVAWPEKWSGPCTVGNMIANLSSIPPETPIYTGYHVILGDQSVWLKVRRPTLSRERVDGTNIKRGDESIPYSAVIWAGPHDPEEARPTPATPEGLREAIEHLRECVKLVPAPGAIERAEAFLAVLQPQAQPAALSPESEG